MRRSRALILATVLLSVALVNACGREGSEFTPEPSQSAITSTAQAVTATSTSELGSGGGLPRSPVPSPSPLPSVSPAATDWQVLTIQPTGRSGRVEFRHSPNWRVTENIGRPNEVPLTIVLRSPSEPTAPQQTLGPDALKIDIVAFPIDAGITCEPPATIPIDFGGLDGYRAVEVPAPGDTSGIERTELRQAEHEGFRYCLSALLGTATGGDPSPEDLLAQFLSTLKIGQ